MCEVLVIGGDKRARTDCGSYLEKVEFVVTEADYDDDVLAMIAEWTSGIIVLMWQEVFTLALLKIIRLSSSSLPVVVCAPLEQIELVKLHPEIGLADAVASISLGHQEIIAATMKIARARLPN